MFSRSETKKPVSANKIKLSEIKPLSGEKLQYILAGISNGRKASLKFLCTLHQNMTKQYEQEEKVETALTIRLSDIFKNIFSLEYASWKRYINRAEVPPLIKK